MTHEGHVRELVEPPAPTPRVVEVPQADVA
jgi:hypothetical protein